MNWINTLDARQAGARSGFLAADLPLEDQDLELGGARVEEEPAPADDELDAMTKAELMHEAEARGVEYPASVTKAELLELLKG